MSYFLYLGILYTFLIYAVYWRATKLNIFLTEALDLAFIIMAFGFIGGRLTHVLFESPEIYRNDWLRVFYIWEGGFVFYGGALLAFGASVLFMQWKKMPLAQWADFYAPICSLGYALGRVSCFIAGCCYGSHCELPWAVNGRHPTQLYAVISESITFLILVYFEKGKRLKAGMLFALWMALHSLGRIFMESFRDDFRGPQWGMISLSTGISLVLLGISSIVLIRKQLA